MPIRSPRVLVELEEITANLDDDPLVIDAAPTQTVDGLKAPLFAKMKLGIAKFLGIEPVVWNDPRMLGVFGGEGLNKGAEYRRNIGGFRVASYTLIAKSKFLIEEEYYDKDTGVYTVNTGSFRTMSIGLPKGHSVHEFISLIASYNNFSEIAAIRTPAGRKIDIFDYS